MSISKVFDTNAKESYKKDLKRSGVVYGPDIGTGAVTQRHIGDEYKVIKFGLSTDRPDGSTRTKVFFATDTNVLSIWNGTAWKTTTLS